MEFFILERHFKSKFLIINSSSQTRVFVLFSALIFPFYKILFMSGLEFSYFSDFLLRIFKTREEYGFLKNPPVEGIVNSMEQKSPVFG